MASSYDDNKGTIQYLAGAHLDRMSETQCNAGNDSAKIDQEVMWLDVLTYPIALDESKESAEFQARMQALMARPKPDGMPDQVWAQKRRYEQARLMVHLLYQRNVLRAAQVPWDDVSE